MKKIGHLLTLLFLTMAFSLQGQNAWEFTSDLEGWGLSGVPTYDGYTPTWDAGHMIITLDADAATAAIPIKVVTSWIVGDLNYAHISMKNLTDDDTAYVYFATDPGFADAQAVPFKTSTQDTEFQNYWVDMTSNDAWVAAKDNYYLAVQVVENPETTGSVEFDFIRFVKATHAVTAAGDATSIDGAGTTLQMSTDMSVDDVALTVNWSVDDASVATVDAAGLVTAVGNGAVIVTATDDAGSGLSGSYTITVANVITPQVNAWEFDTDLEGWTAVGGTSEVVGGNMVFTYSAGDPQVTLSTGNWNSEKQNYLMIRVKNETAETSGTFFGFPAIGGFIPYNFESTPNNTEFEDIYINLAHADWTGDMALLRIDPTPGAADGVFQFDFIRFLEHSPILPTSYTIEGEGGFSQLNGIGNTLQMILSVEPDLGNREAIWTVDDETIATIDANGVLTAVAEGTVTVTATATLDATVSGTAVITVTDQTIDVTGVEVASYMSTITTIGGSLQMEAIITPADAANPAVTWSVDDVSIATISDNGMLTSVAEGSVVVTATSVDQTSISATKSMVVSTAQINAWEFTTDIEGWGSPGGNGSTSVELSQADGALVVDVTGGDPNFYSQTFPTAWVVGDFKYLHLRMKNESNNANGQFFMWRGFPGTTIQAVSFLLDTLQTEFTDVYVNLLDPTIYEQSWQTDWAPENEYHFFRLDPIADAGDNGVNKVSVDFMRFITVAPALESLTIVSEKDTIGTGITLQMSTDPWPNISNGEATWAVDDAAIATIDATTGLLTGVAAGNVTVTATAVEDGAITATKVITVLPNVDVTAIVVSSDASTIFDVIGTQMQMTATLSPENATNKDFTWSVNDEGIATIDQDGVLTILSDGVVTVSATAADASGVVGTTDITITIRIYVMRIAISSASDTIFGLGNEMQMIATLTPGNASDITVTWSVNDASIATIDAEGMLTAVADGIVDVTVTANDGSGVTKTKAIVILDNTAVESNVIHQLRLYPNPAGSRLYIDNVSHLESVTVIDITGHVIKTINNNSVEKLSIDTESIAPGLYMIRATFIEGDVITHTFIKK